MMESTGLSASDVAVLTGNANNRGCNDGFGWGGEWIWVIILFALFGWGGFGGGWGGNGGGFNTPSANGALTRAEMFEGFQGQNMTSALNGIRDGQFSIENALCNGFAGINSNISNLGYQLQDCCCQTQRAVDGVNYNMAMQTNALQNTMNQNANALQGQLCTGFRDVIDSQNAGTRAILDYLCQDKISTLQNENQALRLAASQSNQNAVLTAAMDANTAEIIRRTNPTPVPAYTVPAPYPYGYGCGCNTCGC